MKSLATIYSRKGALFVIASHRTEAGFWIADKDTVTVKGGDENGVQSAVVETLERSKNGIPVPLRDTDLLGSLLSAANVSSWTTFAKLAKCIDVYLKDGNLEIAPYRNLGGKRGFDPMNEKAVTLPNGSPYLRKVVLAVLEFAE